MEAMQRAIDTIAGSSIDELAAVPHTRQGADSSGESRDTFNAAGLHAHSTGPEQCSVSGARGLTNGSTSTYEASANDEEIEDDPLDELASMAPLGKMVTDAETIPKVRNAKTHSFDGSPLSHRSDTRTSLETSTRLPGDPVALGLISETKGRKLLEV